MTLSRAVAIAAASTLAATGLAVIAPSAVNAADVDKAPLRTITGTALGNAEGFTSDDAGRMYVGVDDYVEVFGPTATGTATPIRRIEGAATGLNDVEGLALGPDGLLYAVNDGSNDVRAFAANADGNVAPVRVIGGAATGIVTPTDVDVAADGSVYVADNGGPTPSIRVFAPGATGNVSPVRAVLGASTLLADVQGIEVTPTNELFATVGDTSSINVYAPGANGDIAPSRRIVGASTGMFFPGGIAVDSSGNAYVTEYNTNEVFVFAPGANGDVPPKVRLAGGSTGLDGSWMIDLDVNRNVYVSNYYGDSASVFAPLVPFDKPSVARSVAVSGDAKADQRRVSWLPPTSNGGAPVSYRVSVRAGSTVLLDTVVGPTVRALTLKRIALLSGAHAVSVTARNRAGSAAPVTTAFVVAKFAPSKVRSLKVSGKAKAAKRTVRWVEPASDGGAAITNYRIVVKKGSKVLVTRTVKASKQSLKVKKSKLGKGKHTVLVKAANAEGFGPNAKKKFRVKR